MKISEAKNDKSVKVISTAKKVEVTLTEKHPGYPKRKTSIVPEHMVEHLLKKGMIEKPAKVK